MLSWRHIPVTVSNYGNIEIWITTFGWQWHFGTYHAATQLDKTSTCNPVRGISFIGASCLRANRVWSAMAYRARGVGLSRDRFVCGPAVFWQSEQTVQKDGALGIWGINITPCQNCSGLFQYQMVCSRSEWRPLFAGVFLFSFLKIEI